MKDHFTRCDQKWLWMFSDSALFVIVASAAFSVGIISSHFHWFKTWQGWLTGSYWVTVSAWLLLSIAVLGFLSTRIRIIKLLFPVDAKPQPPFPDAYNSLVGILDSLDVGIYVSDPETSDVLFANQPVKAAFGHENTATAISPVGLCRNERLLKPRSDQSSVSIWEGQNTRNNRWYIIYDQQVKWVDNRDVVIQIVNDITDRKNDEKNIHDFTQALIQSQEKERHKTAINLHDQVAQDLATLRLAFETLFEDSSTVPDAVKQKINHISGVLHRAITDIRDLAYDLHPPGLEQFGLIHASYQFGAEFSEKNGVTVDFFSAGLDGVNIASQAAIQLYRIIQTLLKQMYTYDRASVLTIRLVATHPFIILRVESDGQGYDMSLSKDRLRAERELELQSIRERAELMEGQFSISTSPDHGTRVCLEIPFAIVAENSACASSEIPYCRQAV